MTAATAPRAPATLIWESLPAAPLPAPEEVEAGAVEVVEEVVERVLRWMVNHQKSTQKK